MWCTAFSWLLFQFTKFCYKGCVSKQRLFMRDLLLRPTYTFPVEEKHRVQTAMQTLLKNNITWGKIFGIFHEAWEPCNYDCDNKTKYYNIITASNISNSLQTTPTQRTELSEHAGFPTLMFIYLFLFCFFFFVWEYTAEDIIVADIRCFMGN